MMTIFRLFSKEIYFVLFVSAIINFLFLASPWYMMQVADKVFVHRSFESLYFLTIILLWMFTVMGLLEFVRARIMAAVAFRFEGAFYPRMYEALLVKSADARSASVDHYFADLNNIRMYVTNDGAFGLIDLLFMPLYLVVLCLFSWKLAVFAIVMACLSFVISLANNFFANAEYEKAYELGFKASDEMMSQLRSVEAIKSMGMYPSAKDRWLSKHQQSAAAYFKSNDQLSIWYTLAKNFRYVSMTLIMAASAYLVIENELTIGMMAATGLLLGRVIMPIDMLGSSLKQISHMKHGLVRLSELFAERRIPARNRPAKDLSQGLVVQDLVVRVEAVERLILDHVSFSLPANSCLVVLGANGAGKTTMIKTLSGLVPMTSGYMQFAGQDAVRLRSDVMGYVAQDVTLIDGSLADNICRFGKPNDDMMIDVAKLVGIHDFVMTLKDGYQTEIGSMGMRLSGGQRQLVSLARAIYGSPKLVILDEPNSSLDEQGQQALLRAIVKLKSEGSTIVISTHQYGVLAYADFVMTLDMGKIVLFEPREKLLQRIQEQTNA